MAKIPFTFATGIIGASSVIFAVYSFSSADVTLIVDGGTPQVLSMTGFGIDGNSSTDSFASFPVALYVSTVNLTGLSQSRHALSVTQDAVTRLGMTNPDMGEISSEVIFITCDSPSSDSGGNGAWPEIRARVDAGNVQTIIHTDDHGYTGSLATNDTGPGGTGRFAGEPQVDWTEYSRYLAYAAYLGLMETDVSGSGYVPDFQQPDRIYVRENCPKWGSTGDWELTNNPEERGDLTTAQILTAKNGYLNTVGATTPHINTANSAAWVNRVGPMEVIAYDRCFALTELTQYYDTATETNNIPANKILGDAQLTDIKGQIDSVSPFKVISMSTSARHITLPSFRISERANGWNSSSWFGSQQPLHDYTADTSGDTLSHVSEWRDLTTNNTDGICKIAQDYGAAVFGLHGNTHRSFEYWLYTPADVNNVELDMLECSSGAVNPIFAHRLHSSIVADYDFRGTSVNWISPWTFQHPTGATDPVPSFISILIKPNGPLTVEYIQARFNSPVVIDRSITISRGTFTQGVQRQATI